MPMPSETANTWGEPTSSTHEQCSDVEAQTLGAWPSTTTRASSPNHRNLLDEATRITQRVDDYARAGYQAIQALPKEVDSFEAAHIIALVFPLLGALPAVIYACSVYWSTSTEYLGNSPARHPSTSPRAAPRAPLFPSALPAHRHHGHAPSLTRGAMVPLRTRNTTATRPACSSASR